MGHTVVSRALRRGVIAIGILLLGLGAQSATLYHCKNYSGGTFWASDACSKYRALIDRLVTVPDNMPFEQQVQIGNQARTEADGLTTRPVSQPVQARQQAPKVNCQAISKEIASLDSMARQPQSGGSQDWISQRRKSLRDTQFRSKCR